MMFAFRASVEDAEHDIDLLEVKLEKVINQAMPFIQLWLFNLISKISENLIGLIFCI